jgi:UPF0755 protein
VKKLALLLLVVLVAGGGATYVLYTRVHAPFRGYPGAEQFVDIPSGAGTRVIGERLVKAGVVPDQTTYGVALWLNGKARRLKAGEYRFDRPMTPLDVVDKIARGEVYVINVTFPEGLTIAEMAQIFESHGFPSRAALIEAAKDPTPIRGLVATAPDLEGYLFPDTYPLSRHTDGPQLVRLMVARFEHAFTPALRAAADAHGLSIAQVVTLASMVEKETARPEERPLVAAVYENRLRIGMGLQCDPTVIYALARVGKYTGNLRRDDLYFDSPYNTYRYRGLPPGPIASPGLASLEAVVHPADVDFLYFVSRNDGTHQFSSTLAEHNENVFKYQVLPFRQLRAGRAAAAEGARPTGRARIPRKP